MKLKEGMRIGDLTDLVLPLISIDEYESTISKDAVSVGFYVNDQDAANDFNRFVQKSPVAILSCEVSPAPDKHGYFLVFVEIEYNSSFSTNIKELLQEVKSLCEVDKWKMKIRKIDRLLPFDPEKLQKLLKRIRQTDKKQDTAIVEFFSPSLLENLSFDGKRIVMETASGATAEYEVFGFGSVELLLTKYGLVNECVNLTPIEISRCQRIISMLGAEWSATSIGSEDPYLVVQHKTNKCMILR